MIIQTRYFGEIDLSEDKVITFENGIMGFEDFKKYTLLYDNEKEERPSISWLQSLEEESLALPVVNPFLIDETYNPVVDDELLQSLGELTDENIVLLLVMTIPSEIEKMTANLKAPLVINADSKKGCQIIVENQDYPIKFNAYEALKNLKAKKGDE
ncbi:MAG: flagellar assembly factor FliW [Clostridiales bacterium]|nr:flagellar assembly factor FliW [Clostridiales bacterium]